MIPLRMEFAQLDWARLDLQAIEESILSIAAQLVKLTDTTMDDNLVDLIRTLVRRRYAADAVPTPVMISDEALALAADLPEGLRERVAADGLLLKLLQRVGPLVLQLLLKSLL